MAITSNVKQTIALTADGLAQKYVKTTATTITKARIMQVTGQSSAADAVIKIYNEADSSKTASAMTCAASCLKTERDSGSFFVKIFNLQL